MFPHPHKHNYVRPFDCSYPSRYEVLLYSGFDLHFPKDAWRQPYFFFYAYWLFVHLWRNFAHLNSWVTRNFITESYIIYIFQNKYIIRYMIYKKFYHLYRLPFNIF